MLFDQDDYVTATHRDWDKVWVIYEINNRQVAWKWTEPSDRIYFEDNQALANWVADMQCQGFIIWDDRGQGYTNGWN